MAQQHKMEDGTKRIVDKLISRRKMKKTYEYEVQWKNCTPDQNTYIARDKCASCLFLRLNFARIIGPAASFALCLSVVTAWLPALRLARYYLGGIFPSLLACQSAACSPLY